MNQYIFVTFEGYTYQPDSLSSEPDAENMQVLGFGEGTTAQEALEDMLIKNAYLTQTTFDEVTALELKSDGREHLSIKSFLHQGITS